MLMLLVQDHIWRAIALVKPYTCIPLSHLMARLSTLRLFSSKAVRLNHIAFTVLQFSIILTSHIL